MLSTLVLEEMEWFFYVWINRCLCLSLVCLSTSLCLSLFVCLSVSPLPFSDAPICPTFSHSLFSSMLTQWAWAMRIADTLSVRVKRFWLKAYIWVLKCLTFSQMTNFRLFQTGRVCKQQFQIWWKWEKVLQTGRKHCRKRRNCSLRAISPFSLVFWEDLYSRQVKTRACLGKG